MGSQLVLGVDIGSTHVKGLGIDRQGEVVYRVQWTPHLLTTDDGGFEQDPQEILQIVLQLIEQCSREATVEAVALSTAMHTCLVIDEAGNPLTNTWIWMDQRAANYAAELRKQGLDRIWYAATGCPVHPMSPAVKWLKLRELYPHGLPVSLKDWLFLQLTGQLITDYSTAAASGMMNLHGHWDHDILQWLRLPAQLLPPLQDMTFSLGKFVLGGSDGAMAHHGLGIVADTSHAALTWGTSAAVRVTQSDPRPDHFIATGSFTYFMGHARGYLVGQALSNAGNVLTWAATMFGLNPSEIIRMGIEVANTEAILPHFVPYLYGERSPVWNEALTGGFVGVRSHHERAHLVAAVVVSLLALLKGSVDRLEAGVGSLNKITVGANLGGDTLWGRAVSTMLNRPLEQSASEDASVFGAALLASQVVQWDIAHKIIIPQIVEPEVSWRQVQDRVAHETKWLNSRLPYPVS
ncbi:MAG: FGGY family carbohydrate kinase [Firmicutes bacterium]|nr:FGGY family carbohydrate kinase [Bacillota bacterium]